MFLGRLWDTFNLVGASITLGMGLLGLIFPRAAARITSLSPQGKLGIGEIRATYGGLFVALGAYALWTRQPEAFFFAGLAWAGAAAGRLIHIPLDRNLTKEAIGAFFFEAAIAAALLVR